MDTITRIKYNSLRLKLDRIKKLFELFEFYLAEGNLILGDEILSKIKKELCKHNNPSSSVKRKKKN